MNGHITEVEFYNISVIYNNGTHALVNASLRVPSGTICALVGANGSGKSTLFKAALGLVTPHSGRISLLGRRVQEALKEGLVSYVPQAEEIDWNFPVLVEDVVLMGRYAKMNMLKIPSTKDLQVVKESLAKVELQHLAKRQIGELSGGQKKRVFLARSLAQEAKIILLDEPFTGVDVNTELKIIELLKDLRNKGHIIIVSTHNLGSVPEFCDEVALVKNSILKYGKTEEIFNEKNLALTFGDALRHFRFEHSTVDNQDGKSIMLITDDERPLVLGRGGHLEYSDTKGKEHLLKDRHPTNEDNNDSKNKK